MHYKLIMSLAGMAQRTVSWIQQLWFNSQGPVRHCLKPDCAVVERQRGSYWAVPNYGLTLEEVGYNAYLLHSCTKVVLSSLMKFCYLYTRNTIFFSQCSFMILSQYWNHKIMENHSRCKRMLNLQSFWHLRTLCWRLPSFSQYVLASQWTNGMLGCNRECN